MSRTASPCITLALCIAATLFLLAPAAFPQLPANEGVRPAGAAAEPSHPGRAIYQEHCALCHDNPGATRAAALDVLRGTAPAQLLASLTGDGVMAPMATSLSGDQIERLIAWLTEDQKAAAESWDQAMLCPVGQRTVDLSRGASLSMFGVDLESTRDLSAEQAGLRRSDLKNLELAWAVGYPQTQGLGASPVVVGDTVFANGGGKLMALDAASGCAKWIYDGGPSRSSLTYGEIGASGEVGGRKAIIYAAGPGDVHTVDAQTGELIWKADGRPANGVGGIRAAITQYGDLLIVPISASGVGAGANANFECCVGHGAVVALSAADGARRWEYHTMVDADYNGFVNSLGVKQRGPSGAPIWTTPTIDVRRQRVLVTTGENTSHPATATSDAIIALDLDTGKEVWVFQAMASDVWNMACRGNDESSGPNCPWQFEDENIGRDFDFGGAAVLTQVGGRDIVLAGQKSGHLWALDAATGEELWQRRVGGGTPLGGNHWGIAIDGERAFLTINDSISRGADLAKPGVFAFAIADGAPIWGYDAKPDCEGERGKAVVNCESKFGFSATPLVVDGALIAGTLDGKLFAFDGATGEILKVIDTIGPVPTTNGVEGKAGSIDSHAVAAGGGMVLVASGYASFRQTAGNVLMAFRPKAD
jgi:polyvinyl alcohol dehydrogenase (cytochrome)